MGSASLGDAGRDPSKSGDSGLNACHAARLEGQSRGRGRRHRHQRGLLGFAALRGLPPSRRFIFLILVFGLIHGLSTRLRDLGLPEQGPFARVIAFNVGIEIGQLIVIALMSAAVVLVLWLWRARTAEATELVTYVLGVWLMFMSVIAVGDVAYREPIGGGAEFSASAAQCVEGLRTRDFPTDEGHTSKSSFEPDETTPMEDFGHSLADGYVAFLYRPDLPVGQVDQLLNLVTADPGCGVLAGPAPGLDTPVVAVTMSTELACQAVSRQILDATAALEPWK